MSEAAGTSHTPLAKVAGTLRVPFATVAGTLRVPFAFAERQDHEAVATEDHSVDACDSASAQEPAEVAVNVKGERHTECACYLEEERGRRYPISRWYVRPLAGRLAGVLSASRVRPNHVTLCGLLLVMATVTLLLVRPEMTLLGAGLVLAIWFCDRLDGQLARRQGTASAFGSWLDGNVDELADVSLHVAVGYVAATRLGTSWPWFLVVAFLAGKYLFTYGVQLEREIRSDRDGMPSDLLSPWERSGEGEPPQNPVSRRPHPKPLPKGEGSLHTLWHLPGNADVRIHLLILALASGWLATELAVIAVYYNLRWIARYRLAARRLGGCR